MATYTYQCLECENTFDVQATIQEKEEGKGAQFICSKCHSKKIKQKFSVVRFIGNIFKGDGTGGGCCSEKKSCCCKSKKGPGGCC